MYTHENMFTTTFYIFCSADSFAYTHVMHVKNVQLF